MLLLAVEELDSRAAEKPLIEIVDNDEALLRASKDTVSMHDVS